MSGTLNSRIQMIFNYKIEEAFYCLLNQNHEARKNLIKTKNFILIHSIGKSDSTKTVLTSQEFCEILTKIRNNL